MSTVPLDDSLPRWSVCQGMIRGGDVPTDASIAAGAGFEALGLELESVLACGPAVARSILGALAVARDVQVALEPVHPLLRSFSYVHTLGHATDIVEGLEHIALGVDTGHLWWDPRLVPTFTAHAEQVVSVQLTDISTEALAAWRYERAELGAGDVPLAVLLRAFHDAGYRGFYEAEVLLRMPRDDRPRMVRDTLAWLRRTWNETIAGR